MIRPGKTQWGWLKKPRQILKTLAWLGGFLSVTFVVTEFVVYYPVTFLGLETDFSTRIEARTNEATVAIVGDIMLWDSMQGAVRADGFVHPFRSTLGILTNADCTVGNLEGPLTTAPIADDKKRFSYRVPPESVRGLVEAGFDVMTLANNHIRDCGDAGVASSLDILDKAGILAVGGGTNAAQAYRPRVVDVRGVRVAFVNVMSPVIGADGKPGPNDWLDARAEQAGAAIGLPDRVKAMIADARQRADLVLVIAHVGERYEDDMDRRYGAWLRTLVDLGADAVICHGSHALGPVETYKGRPIWYGIGNFAFGSRNIRVDYALIAVLHVDRQTKKLVRVRGIPLYACNANLFIDHQTRILTGYRAGRVLDGLIERSAALSSGLVRARNTVWQEFFPRSGGSGN